MGTKEVNLERIRRSGVIAILRTERGDLLADVAEALVAGGIDCVEVTFTVPRPGEVLESVAKRMGDRVLLGAGTILDTETARVAITAGAEFIVAPNTNFDVIRFCRRYDRLVMPGAMTPTEVLAAWEAGADVVKIFPSDVLGPGHLRALRGPLPQVRMMPTGGVTAQTAAAFFAAGAFAVGVGGCLVEPQAIRDRNFARIEQLARELVQVVAEARRVST